MNIIIDDYELTITFHVSSNEHGFERIVVSKIVNGLVDDLRELVVDTRSRLLKEDVEIIRIDVEQRARTRID